MGYEVRHLPRLTAQIDARLSQLKGRGSAGVAAKVQAALVARNRADRLAALDRFGRRMPPRKRPRPDGARGPVMSPHYTRARDIANYFARVTYKFGQGAWTLTAGVRDAAFLVFHAEGRVKGAPVRDVLGTSPQGHADVRRIFHDEVGAMHRSKPTGA